LSEFWIFKLLAEQVSHDHLPPSMVSISVSWKVASVAADSSCMAGWDDGAWDFSSLASHPAQIACQ